MNKEMEATRQRVFDRISTTDPQVVRYSNYLLNLLPSRAAVIKFLRGTFALALQTDEPFYHLLAASSDYLAGQRGISHGEVDRFLVAPSLHGVMSVEQAIADRNNAENRKPLTIGLWHGHVRIFTPGSLVAAILASEQCDRLFIGLEEGWRTQKYKTPILLYEGATRAAVALYAGIAHRVFMIGDSVEYSDDGYRKLVTDFSPDIYFGEQMRAKEMQMRARLANAQFIRLPTVRSFSTTQYLNDLRGRHEISPIVHTLGKQSVSQRVMRWLSMK